MGILALLSALITIDMASKQDWVLFPAFGIAPHEVPRPCICIIIYTILRLDTLSKQLHSLQ